MCQWLKALPLKLSCVFPIPLALMYIKLLNLQNTGDRLSCYRVNKLSDNHRV